VGAWLSFDIQTWNNVLDDAFPPVWRRSRWV
jgi:hypothetical protein